MTLNRITVTLTTLIAAMFALLLIAAFVGAAGPAAGSSGSGFTGGTASMMPWHKAAPAHPEYARTIYREHHMCDEVHHKAIKSPAVSP